LKVANTAAAPAVKASCLLAGKVSIEFAALAVVPMTCRNDKPASFLFDFAPIGLEGVLAKGELEGVDLVHGLPLRREVGVAIDMLALNSNYHS
jgi:hypothetical protein